MSTYTVVKGPGQQLLGAPSDKSVVIQNKDSVNSIWLSASQPSPGNGLELQPLANTTWSPKAGPIWACLDSGNVASVDVDIADEIDQITDPLATAVATAAQLLATGVPNVLQADVIEATELTIVGGAQPSVSFDVSKYTSLVMYFRRHGGAIPAGGTLGRVSILQQLNGKQIQSDDFVGSLIEMQVSGDTMFIYNNDSTAGVSTTVYVVGTNRVLDKRISAAYNDGNVEQWTIVGQAMVVGGVYPLTAAGLINIEGQAWVTVTVSGAMPANGGRLELINTSALFGAGTLVVVTDAEFMTALSTGAKYWQGMIAVPVGDWTLQWNSNAAITASVTVNVTKC